MRTIAISLAGGAIAAVLFDAAGAQVVLKASHRATLSMPIYTAGALFSVGDAYAAQGQGDQSPMRLIPERRELMLILGADHSAGDTRGRYRVTQKVSPHVVIVEPAGDATKEELQAMNGVVAVLEPGESPAGDVRATLTDTEALFVDAYAQRSRSRERPGEGLDWDADGFLPPDLPPKR